MEKTERIFGNFRVLSEVFKFCTTALNHLIKETLFSIKISNICVKIHDLC